MSAHWSASVLFRVCLPMVSWAERVPPAAEPAPPGLASRGADDLPDEIYHLIQGASTIAEAFDILPGPASFTDAAIGLGGGYEWDLPRADGSTPDWSPCGGPDTLSAGMDIGADSGRWFLWAEKDDARTAPNDGRNGSSAARQPGHGEKDWEMETMSPKAPAGRWLRISQTEAADMDVIGWNTLRVAPGREELVLCFIGLLGIAPSMLRQRGPAGGKHTRRHRRFHARWHPTARAPLPTRRVPRSRLRFTYSTAEPTMPPSTCAAT